jgi:hypothetical protein
MFSIHINGDTGPDALRQLAQQLDAIVVDQSVHLLDRDLVLEVAEHYIDTLHDPSGHNVILSVAGNARSDERSDGTGAAELSLDIRVHLSEKPGEK